MISNAFALVYTGESNMQLRDLTFSRSIAAVPFGGRYRCIDFIMSNIVNSGVYNLGLIVQKNYHSLIDHVGSGKEWDLHRKRDGLFILPPFVTKDNLGIYEGTADAISSVMGYVRRSSQKYVILTGSHTIFNTTFNEMLDRHIKTGADITIMYNMEPLEPAEPQFDDLRLELDENTGRVRDLMINPYRPTSGCRSCDVFIMQKELLEYLVEEAQSHALHDFIRDILIRKMNTLKIYGYRYDGYVARLDSMSEYYKHNMALLDPRVRADLFNSAHPIYTKVKDEVPAKYSDSARVVNSMVADGCVIEGSVENSLLFRGVHVGHGAVLKNCIIMQGSDISENAELDCVILDKSVTVKPSRRLAGYGDFPVILRKNSVV